MLPGSVLENGVPQEKMIVMPNCIHSFVVQNVHLGLHSTT